MTKQEWAQLMVGSYGYDKNIGVYRIVSWVDPDKPQYPDVAGRIICFIVETEVGLPYTIKKKFLRKYASMTQEAIKTSLELTWGVGGFSSKAFFEDHKEEREYIQNQIKEHNDFSIRRTFS